MSRIPEAESGTKVYVGNLEPGVSPDELQSLFKKYGQIAACWVARNPPGFAFVTFEDSRDAQDAVRALDGSKYNNKPMRVEVARGNRGPRSEWRGPPREGHRNRYDAYGSPPRERRRSPSYGNDEYRRRERSRSMERRGRSYSREKFAAPKGYREEEYRESRDGGRGGYRGGRYR